MLNVIHTLYLIIDMLIFVIVQKECPGVTLDTSLRFCESHYMIQHTLTTHE